MTVDAPASAIWEALGEVIDPELGLSITELGLVYAAELDADGVAHVAFTTTTPVCPLGEYLTRMIEFRLRDVPAVDHVEVELVRQPLWHPDMMTDGARRKLGWET